MLHKGILLECNVCGSYEFYEGSTKRGAIKRARRDGMYISNSRGDYSGYVLCPECQKGPETYDEDSAEDSLEEEVKP